MNTESQYALIGAGPMGLCSARRLQQYGVAFTGFELHDDVGGLWDIDNPHSTLYQSAHLISSKKMTEFADFPMKATTATYPNHRELRDYFRDYAKAFDLYKHFEFSTKVVRCAPDGDGWLVTTAHNGSEQSRRFKGLLIANGTLHQPQQVELPGIFGGELLHGRDYKTAQQLAGKRVLIQGCGNSACDIAVDAVHVAASVDISVRRGYYFLPKFIMGKATDSLGGLIKLPRRLKQWADALLIRVIIGKPSQYGLPDPDYRLYESHPVVNSLVLHHLGHGDIRPRPDIAQVSGERVTFSDGSHGDYDLILQATGYQLSYPFIDKSELNWTGMAPALYLNVFHPHHKNLLMLGMVEAAGLGWQGRDEQAEMMALMISQEQHGSASAKKIRAIIDTNSDTKIDGGYSFLQLERMAYYVDKASYRNTVLAHIETLKADWPQGLPPSPPLFTLMETN